MRKNREGRKEALKDFFSSFFFFMFDTNTSINPDFCFHYAAYCADDALYAELTGCFRFRMEMSQFHMVIP